ncbi:MAG: enoyl-CoA hydratase-related protein [Pseudolabrys sp.]
MSAFAPAYEWRKAVAWSIERRNQHVALVTMNTNKANAQNPTFFEDLHRAFDRLEAEFNDCAVVLTGTGRVFSAGLDFDHHFPLFARRSTSEVDAWFDTYRATNRASSLTRARRWRRSTDMLTLAGL